MDRQPGQVAAIELDAPAVGRDETDNHVEARRLAGAIRAEEPHDFAAADFERHVVHHRPRLVAFLESRDGEPACRASRFCAGVGRHFTGVGASSPAGFSVAGGVGTVEAAALSTDLPASLPFGSSGVSDFG